jgi:heat shock protein HslJ
MKPYLLLCLFLITSCSALKPNSDLPKLGESVWNLTAIEQRPVNFDGRAFIKFNEKENRISGKALCNSYFSDYEMIGQKITFSSVGSTKMYCEGMMDEENQIITQLQKTKRYEVKSDFLYFYSGEKVVLTFKR